MCLLTDNVNDYHFVSQGKTTIPGVDDGLEFELTDVRLALVTMLKSERFSILERLLE